MFHLWSQAYTGFIHLSLRWLKRISCFYKRLIQKPHVGTDAAIFTATAALLSVFGILHNPYNHNVHASAEQGHKTTLSWELGKGKYYIYSLSIIKKYPVQVHAGTKLCATQQENLMSNPCAKMNTQPRQTPPFLLKVSQQAYRVSAKPNLRGKQA